MKAESDESMVVNVEPGQLSIQDNLEVNSTSIFVHGMKFLSLRWAPDYQHIHTRHKFLKGEI